MTACGLRSRGVILGLRSTGADLDDPDNPVSERAYTITLRDGATWDQAKQSRLRAAQQRAIEGAGYGETLFESTGQALFFSYWMEVTPPSSKGATQLLVEDLMERRYGASSIDQRTINMGSMTPLELRAQCAMIRMTCDRLPDQERDVLRARFGHQYTRAIGVEGLGEHLREQCSSSNDEAILALLWAVFSSKVRRDDFSLRKIEKRYGVNKSTLHRDQQRLREACQLLEIRAQESMEFVFIQSGLIPNPAHAGKT